MKPQRQISREESKSITRKRLLRSATDLLRHSEPAAITMADITSGAGVSQPAFYGHFDSKDQCLSEALDAEIQAIRDALGKERRGLVGQPVGPDSLENLLRRAYTVLAASGEGFKLVAREMHSPKSRSTLIPGGLKEAIVDDMVNDVPMIAATFGIEYDVSYLRMVGDGLIGASEYLVTSYIDGRHQDIEAIVRIMMAYLRGTIPELMDALCGPAQQAAR